MLIVKARVGFSKMFKYIETILVLAIISDIYSYIAILTMKLLKLSQVDEMGIKTYKNQ